MSDGGIPGERRFPALALVNTRVQRSGVSEDLLADPTVIRDWLADRGLISADARVDETEAAAVRAFRESLRALLTARESRRVPPPADLTALNAALTAPALVWDGGGPRRVRRPVPDEVQGALADLAANAVDLLSGEEAASLASCSAHGCIRFFLRTHAARQWCSNRCGDRVRAARHYARRRSAAGS
ncbi:CGNR zinc finger domain-containing protein [Actinoallomurus rhizosphaericola]|uniref:CGNR zinc finger domain-containing protein n=1 Tax=Actinoallomurus rhizosphaericola TaxID=2952536 RepID=UPI00209026FA|nr:ABATE domain-containing protein [Actinoallomurus rhizosphaericola]MCO5992446.1 ABATE domain-containing protein [Actinoallomurus rhizosphaericola]